jgi:dTDP-4-dehydrorhamnose 3,5-epimerase
MHAVETALPEVFVLEPKFFPDGRGGFFESFNLANLRMILQDPKLDFVQDNHSISTGPVLRGIHYQIKQAQGKLVRVIQGEIFDVAVDLRRNSPHFGKHIGVILSAENRKQLWIPPGFGHGFLVMSEYAECLYKTTAYYAKEHERSIIWNDPTLNIPWPLQSDPILSEKDLQGHLLNHAEVYA